MNTTSNKTGWGKPKYGAQSFQKTGKPVEGDNPFRILPPMHSLAEVGKWALYESTHWGYYGVNPDPKGDPIMRPFRCIQVRNRKTGIIEQECPACTQFDIEDKKAASQLADLQKAGTSESEIETVMASINGWIYDHRPERKWYINVMYSDGTFGDYKLNHKFHKKGLDALIQKYQEEEGKDPLDLDDGCWFNIARTGKGRNTVDKVDFAKDTIEVPVNGKQTKVEIIRTGALTDEQKNRALESCRDLNDLGGLRVTYEQIYELVNCDLEPETVDRILGISKEAAATPASKPVSAAKPPVAPKSETKPTSEKLADKAKETAPAADPKAALAARAAKILADRKAKEEAEKAAAAAATKADAVDPSTMSDEDFMKYFDEQAAAAPASA